MRRTTIFFSRILLGSIFYFFCFSACSVSSRQILISRSSILASSASSWSFSNFILFIRASTSLRCSAQVSSMYSSVERANSSSASSASTASSPPWAPRTSRATCELPRAPSPASIRSASCEIRACPDRRWCCPVRAAGAFSPDQRCVRQAALQGATGYLGYAVEWRKDAMRTSGGTTRAVEHLERLCRPHRQAVS